MEWKIKKYQDLTNDELYQILKARVDVFVVEQNCTYPELDNYDQECMHYFLIIDNEIAANVRILPKQVKFDEVSIGRVLVVEKFRKNGYARQIMQRAIDFVRDEWNENKIRIQAQVYLKDFYASLGFWQISEMYMEDGIPHIDMIWERG
ncbi:GNAT family N-acetyltransferase [Oceanobacillus bengalensis]|uniref:GNAT family N-acetyltransferase n=1 Tax=Oceanobacillus bengalensis TaxID=1435466 RepID=A0A494YS92_9BACI|nr:GNAT family N-acetyltransferase [Oceanobacillus bengalensis]RKQ12807.1 GNAT family N-acetyltransferase [Oceanobacillus bengalensis]